MAMEFLVAAVVIAVLSVVVYRTDTSNQIVQPLITTLELSLEYVVDASANQAKLAGKWIIRQAGNLASLAIDFVGAIIWTILVISVRVFEIGLQFAGSSLKKYLPIVIKGLHKEACRTINYLAKHAGGAGNLLVHYAPIAWEWTVNNTKIASEVTWSGLVIVGTSVKKYYHIEDVAIRRR